MITAALFEPFVLWQACYERPEWVHRPLMAVHRDRVVHASKRARHLGALPGMPRASAQLLSDEAVILPAEAPLLQIHWEALQGELAGLTPWVEGLGQGRVLLRVSETEAGQLAAAFGARVGVAASREIALLAALSAYEGQSRVVPPRQEPAFLEALPLRFLAGLGLSGDALEHLAWLGVTQVGGLLAWRQTQLEAYLGPEAPLVSSSLFGPWRQEVARYQPPETLHARYDFEDPVSEPYQLEPVLGLLARRLHAQLTGRAAHKLILKAMSGGLIFPALRVAATTLAGVEGISRLAGLALHDSGAQALGIESLELSLSGLYHPVTQPGLWPRKAMLAAARDKVRRRFPDTLAGIRADNLWSPAAEQRYALVGLNDGATRAKQVSEVLPIRQTSPSRMKELSADSRQLELIADG